MWKRSNPRPPNSCTIDGRNEYYLATLSGAPAPNIYLAHTFAESANKLGETARNKAWGFWKFKEQSPCTPIHLETILDTRDEQLRSAASTVRTAASRPARATISCCSGSQSMMTPMIWAWTKRFDINPAIGSWQIVDLKWF